MKLKRIEGLKSVFEISDIDFNINILDDLKNLSRILRWKVEKKLKKMPTKVSSIGTQMSISIRINIPQ